jgi:hypothetical protein
MADNKTSNLGSSSASVDWSTFNSKWLSGVLKQAEKKHQQERKNQAIKTRPELEQAIVQFMGQKAEARQVEFSMPLNTTLTEAELQAIVKDMNTKGGHTIQLHAHRPDTSKPEVLYSLTGRTKEWGV